MNTICIFGDSITYGAYDVQGGWAQRVKQSEEKKGNLIYVLGIDGDTSTGLLRRFECEATARQPNVIIFAIGINDSVYRADGSVETSLGKFKKNIEKLIPLARRFTSQICVLGLTPVDETKTQPIPWSTTGKCYSNEVIQQYDSILEEVSISERVQFLSLFSVLSSSDLEDGLHPQERGHQKIAETILKKSILHR